MGITFYHRRRGRMKEVIDNAVDQAKDYVEEQTKELDAQADSLVAKAVDALTKVKESNWTWFAVGASVTLLLIAVIS
jgi:hypothetical protein